jgi:hypothetical protein
VPPGKHVGVGGKKGTRPFLSLEEMNARPINETLEKAGGKINGPGEAAEIPGIHPNPLRKRMSKLGIPYGRKSWQPYLRG